MDSPVASTSARVNGFPDSLLPVSHPPAPARLRFTAYTTRLFPISGFSACSASRVTAGLRMMSQTSSR